MEKKLYRNFQVPSISVLYLRIKLGQGLGFVLYLTFTCIDLVKFCSFTSGYSFLGCRHYLRGSRSVLLVTTRFAADDD